MVNTAVTCTRFIVVCNLININYTQDTLYNAIDERHRGMDILVEIIMHICRAAAYTVRFNSCIIFNSFFFLCYSLTFLFNYFANIFKIITAMLFTTFLKQKVLAFHW